MSDHDPAEITLRAETLELERLNGWRTRLCERHGLPERLALQLDICLTELVTNILSYAYPGEKAVADPAVAVRCAVGAVHVVLEIEDHGVPFDPLAYVPAALPRTLEESQIGGRGLLLVRRFGGDMRYVRDGHRNRLTLTFPRSGP